MTEREGRGREIEEDPYCDPGDHQEARHEKHLIFVEFETDQPSPWSWVVLGTDEEEEAIKKLIEDTLGSEAYDLYVGPTTAVSFEDFKTNFTESFGDPEDDDEGWVELPDATEYNPRKEVSK